MTGLDAQEEYPRPQYLARLAHIKKKSINIITNTEEPKVPYWKMRFPATILSFSIVLLLVCQIVLLYIKKNMFLYIKRSTFFCYVYIINFVHIILYIFFIYYNFYIL